MTDVVSQGVQQEEVSYDTYRIWKRNCIVLYDLCISHILIFPTLALGFQSYVSESLVTHSFGAHEGKKNTNAASSPSNTSYASIGFIIGTNTPTTGSDREQNYLYVKELALPCANQTIDSDSIIKRDTGVIVGGYGSSLIDKLGSFHDLHWITFPSEANAIACCPHDKNLLAALSNDSVYLYNLVNLKRCSNESEDSIPVAILEGLETEGFSLKFSATRPFFLAGADRNGNVCWWDCKECKLLGRVKLQSDINGLVIHNHCPILIIVVTDGGEIVLIDTRACKVLKSYQFNALLKREGTETPLIPTAIALSPHDEFSAIIADSSGTLHLFNLCSLDNGPLKSMAYHTGAVYQLEWSPFYPSYVLSGSEDSRVVLWDLAQQTRRNVLDDQHSGLPPEVLFIHGGHTTFITAVAWHPLIPNLIGSAAEDNSLQFWWPSADYMLSS